MEKNITYLDYNATTPTDARVLEAIYPYFNQSFGNASSLYAFGNEAKKALDTAREHIAELINAEADEISFTSGATEGINLALKGLALHPANNKKHIITCQTEHKAVLETCAYLETIGFTVDYLPVDKNGAIDLDVLQSAIKNDTLLICLMWVNNETGVIHPIDSIGKIAQQAGIYFVCDGTQGLGKLPLDVNRCDIDILCFSGHKIYAPKGIGGMYVRQNLLRQHKIQPLIHGGGQENGLRSGTYNVPFIVGLGKACAIAREEMQENQIHIERLKNFLEKELLQIERASINGKSVSPIYNTVNVCIPGFDTEIFIGMNKDIAISNGSACSSALVQPSHVLLAMGLHHEDAMSSMRISLGKENTLQDIQVLLQRIHHFIMHLK